MNSTTAVDPIPQKIPPRDLYFWPKNPRYTPLEDWAHRFDENNVKTVNVQRRYVRRVKASDDDTARSLKRSIKAHGLLGNPMTPITVCSLPDNGYVVIDGNARVLAIKELLSDRAWCAAYPKYAESLGSGILVMDYGAFSDPDVQLAVLAYTARVHWGDLKDEDGKFCPNCDLPCPGGGWCYWCTTPPGRHP